MKKTITILLAIWTGTACMAPMEEDPLVEDTEGIEDADVGESGQELAVGGRQPLGYRNGDKCTIDDGGTERHGTRDGGFCCFENGRGNEECFNCYFYDCTDGWNVSGGGWGLPILDQLGH
jgi:hypothetical protein